MSWVDFVRGVSENAWQNFRPCRKAKGLIRAKGIIFPLLFISRTDATLKNIAAFRFPAFSNFAKAKADVKNSLQSNAPCHDQGI